MSKLIDTVYEKNKVLWWNKQTFKTGELHHLFKRVGMFKCCPHFFIKGDTLHEKDYVWLRGLRQLYRADKLLAEKNFIKNMYCRELIFPECRACCMPKEIK